MDVKIINYAYYNNKSSNDKYNAPVLILFCRDKDYQFYSIYVCDKINLAPEMYVEKKEWNDFFGHNCLDEYPIVKWEDGPTSNYGEETVTIYTTFPWQVKNLRKIFTHTYLSDIKWEKMCIEKIGLTNPYIRIPDDFDSRWLQVADIQQLEEKDHFYVPIRWVAWDIETNAEPIFPNFNGFKDAENCDIISISAYDNYTKSYHRFYWHPKGKQENRQKNWHRKGDYYIPSLNKTIHYDNFNQVYDHCYDNEADMLREYFKWFSEIRPDAQMGFNSEGGYKISTQKGQSRKYWFDGYDMPFLYHRCKTIGLLDDIQKMSPMPQRHTGVKFRVNGDRHSVSVEGLCQIDFIYTTEIFGYHKKFDKFREGNLNGYMSFFLGFGKLDHSDEQIWEMWKNDSESDYDPTGDDNGVVKQRNIIKELFEAEKNALM